MGLSRDALKAVMAGWEQAWNNHDLHSVMALFHEDILFEHWHGATVKGKENLQAAWTPWFRDHGDFRFTTEDFIVDEGTQKVLYQWELAWPSLEQGFEGKPEKRRGVDVLHFKDGKIIKKLSYTKTTLDIDGGKVRCQAIAT